MGGNKEAGSRGWQRGPELARDYHDHGVIAGDYAESIAQDQLQRPRVGSLNHAVQARLSRVAGGLEQRAQQPGADAAPAMHGQQHDGELGLAVLRDILAMAQHGAVVGERQDRHALVLIEQINAAQQGLVRRLAMREMALVEAFAIHRREESRDPLAILRTRPAQGRRQQVVGPRLAGAHGRSPAMKSAIARITIASPSTRRCPRPRVSSRRALGQLR